MESYRQLWAGASSWQRAGGSEGCPGLEAVREVGHHPSLRGMEMLEGGNHGIMELLRLEKSSRITDSTKVWEAAPQCLYSGGWRGQEWGAASQCGVRGRETSGLTATLCVFYMQRGGWDTEP